MKNLIPKTALYVDYQKQGGQLDFYKWEKEIWNSTAEGAEELLPTIQEKGHLFSTRDKTRQIFVSAVDMSIIESVAQLPAEIRIQMMELTESEMLYEIEAKKKHSSDLLLQLLSKKWFWRETGDEVDFEYAADFMPNNKTIKDLKAAVKKNKLTKTEMDLFIDWFVGPKSDVFDNELF